jgi:hypothetical protein
LSTCAKCGQLNYAGRSNCSSCGAPLHESKQSDVYHADAENNQTSKADNESIRRPSEHYIKNEVHPAKNNKAPKKRKGILVISVIIILALKIGLWFLFKQKSSSSIPPYTLSPSTIDTLEMGQPLELSIAFQAPVNGNVLWKVGGESISGNTITIENLTPGNGKAFVYLNETCIDSILFFVKASEEIEAKTKLEKLLSPVQIVGPNQVSVAKATKFSDTTQSASTWVWTIFPEGRILSRSSSLNHVFSKAGEYEIHLKNDVKTAGKLKVVVVDENNTSQLNPSLKADSEAKPSTKGKCPVNANLFKQFQRLLPQLLKGNNEDVQYEFYQKFQKSNFVELQSDGTEKRYSCNDMISTFGGFYAGKNLKASFFEKQSSGSCNGKTVDKEVNTFYFSVK